MSKLNLDIFEPPEEILTKTESPKEQGHEVVRENTPSNIRRSQKTSKSGADAEKKTGSPKFVPVGFHPYHLRILDEAVLRLRHAGHWKASKSAIIRRLLEENADRLVDVFLGNKN